VPVLGLAQRPGLEEMPGWAPGVPAIWQLRCLIAFAARTFNLVGAPAMAGGMASAGWATLRRRIITVPARLASTRR